MTAGVRLVNSKIADYIKKQVLSADPRGRKRLKA
jgi:hypothetical protein